MTSEITAQRMQQALDGLNQWAPISAGELASRLEWPKHRAHWIIGNLVTARLAAVHSYDVSGRQAVNLYAPLVHGPERKTEKPRKIPASRAERDAVKHMRQEEERITPLLFKQNPWATTNKGAV